MEEDLSKIQDNELSVLGLSKMLRRNLVLTIMAIQFVAICFLGKYSMNLNQRITDIKTAQADSANAMYNRLVNQIATKMEPLQQQVNNIKENVEINDSLTKIKCKK